MMELKPCPFCGGEAEIENNGYFVDVSCKDMNCRGFADCLKYKNEVGAIAKAIDAWNRRTP